MLSWRRVGPCWRVFAPCWRYVGPCWRVFAPCWRYVGPRWLHDGALLGHVGTLGAMLGHVGAIWALCWSPCFRDSLEPPKSGIPIFCMAPRDIPSIQGCCIANLVRDIPWARQVLTNPSRRSHSKPSPTSRQLHPKPIPTMTDFVYSDCCEAHANGYDIDSIGAVCYTVRSGFATKPAARSLTASRRQRQPFRYGAAHCEVGEASALQDSLPRG